MEVPITTGPTFGVTFWGLQGFPQPPVRATDFVFDASEMYYRRSTPSNFNAYHLEGWVFGARMWAGVRGAVPRLSLSMTFQYFEGTGSNLAFRVLPLAGRSFLAVMVTRIQVRFPAESGFVLSSPSDREDGADTANSMFAMYPRLAAFSAPARDLTFQPPVPS
jgi:hypothetical protein